MTQEDKKSDENKQEKNAALSSNSESNPASEQIIPPIVPSESEEEEIISHAITDAELPEFKSKIGRKLFGPQITSKQAPPTPSVPKELRKLNLRIELKLIVLFQVVFVLKSFYSVPREDIAIGMLGILEYKGIIVKEKRIVRRAIELWHANKLDIVDCYLIACLEGDRQNILYSYDRDFDKFEINRKEP